MIPKAAASSSHLLVGKCKQTQAAILRGRSGSEVPQGQGKLSQVCSLTSAAEKLSQSLSLGSVCINCSNTAVKMHK